jgi:hypothetical protein
VTARRSRDQKPADNLAGTGITRIDRLHGQSNASETDRRGKSGCQSPVVSSPRRWSCSRLWLLFRALDDRPCAIDSDRLTRFVDPLTIRQGESRRLIVRMPRKSRRVPPAKRRDDSGRHFEHPGEGFHLSRIHLGHAYRPKQCSRAELVMDMRTPIGNCSLRAVVGVWEGPTH